MAIEVVVAATWRRPKVLSGRTIATEALHYCSQAKSTKPIGDYQSSGAKTLRRNSRRTTAATIATTIPGVFLRGKFTLQATAFPRGGIAWTGHMLGWLVAATLASSTVGSAAQRSNPCWRRIPALVEVLMTTTRRPAMALVALPVCGSQRRCHRSRVVMLP